MPTDPRRAKELFAAALDRTDPADRAAFLDRECGGDAELRARLAVRLAARDNPHPALEQPLPAPPGAGDGVSRTAPHVGDGPAADCPGPVDAAGAVVAGRYKLLEVIGEGGMGSVWMAEQREPVRRKVAVKLIKPGMDSKSVVARFEAERQALARMDHPHIAKVLDGGTTAEGRPFFVMELVKGLPLTEYCDARRLSVRDRLELFGQVCSAVQHAHQKGVIHRDLKPSNILVTEHDGRPVPKVIDFGLAKALGAAGALTDRTLHTAFGAVVGTPLYMAPEQVGINALDVDTRTDVYALGVILYELLTGSTPLEKKRLREAVWDEMKRLIREEEPPRPSARLSTSDALPSLAANRQAEPKRLTALVRGELDWIVMKALEKDRNRRYETASGLAADVRRHLDGEPVQAVPPGAAYRLKKFLRRNRGPAAAAALVLFALVAGIAGTTWGMIRADRQREGADRARDEKGRALEAERAARATARRALEEMTSRVMDDVLDRQEALTPAQRSSLERALAEFESFAAEAGDDPETGAGVARAHRRVGDILYRFGRVDDALRAYDRARERFAALVAARPDDPPARVAAVEVLAARADVLSMHRRPGAEAAEFELLGQAERLAADFPAGRAGLALLARVLRSRVKHLNDFRRAAEALPVLDRAEAVTDRLYADRPDDPAAAAARAALLDARLICRDRAGDHPPPADHLPVIALYERAAVGPPPDPRAAANAGRMRLNLSTYYLVRGDDDRAIDECARAERWLVELTGTYPGNLDYRMTLGQTYLNWGRAARRAGRPEAGEVARQAVAVWARLARLNPDRPGYSQGLACAEGILAEVVADAGRVDDALALFDTALGRLNRIVARSAANSWTYGDLRGVYAGRAEAYERKGEFAAAATDWARAAEYAGKNTAATAHLARRAVALVRAGRPAEGLALADRVAADPNPAPDTLRHLASARARALGAGHGDPARVVEVLRAAANRGELRTPDRLRWLREAPEFEVVRGRADFRGLLDSLPPEQAPPAAGETMSADPLPPDGAFAAVYDELRRLAAAKLAGEPAGHTLDATALVHEAYLRLAGGTGFASKGQFVRAAAEAMRRILVDHARKKRAGKRGGGARRHDLAGVERAAAADPDTVIAIEEALAALAAEDPQAAEVARLRLFARLSADDAADALGVSRATAFRDWAYAQAWLTAALGTT